jgi:RimJ/RimL family protein N-acetyltransferase
MYKIIRVYYDYIDEYFKNVDSKDIQYFDINYNKMTIKRKKFFLYKLESYNNNKNTTVGLFGMFLITKDTAKTFFLHLNSSERGKGIGYFLQYLRLFLTKKIFPSAKYIVTLCEESSTRAIRLYDKIYRIDENRSRLTNRTKAGTYIRYKSLLNYLINIDNDIVKFIKINNSELIRNIMLDKNKLIDLSSLNKNKNS